MIHRIIRIGLILTTIMLINVTILSQDDAPVRALDRIQRATVFIMQLQDTGTDRIIRCVGSGTIVDRRGLIVSNAHNTVPNPDCPGEELVIALTISPDEPPIPVYRAAIAQANAGLDLALLRITEELNGRVIEPESLFLPFVELDDSDQILLDDTIFISGYPQMGNDAVETLVGTVSGFVAEPGGGERAWIKTDAAIPGTMTGGGIYNDAERLIGVSTTVPVSGTGASNCFQLEDTDGNGLVNQNDVCVPIGGFINALRPSNFVRPLLRSAALGLNVEKVSEPAIPAATDSEPTFSKLIISQSVTNGQPSTVVGSLPSGTTSLYLFFDYADMTPETIYELRVLRDDTPDPRFSLAPVRWSGGRNGTWYIGSSGVVWPNGSYTFELFLNGLPAQTKNIEIGLPDTQEPTFRNISFGLEVDGNLKGTGNVLPSGSRVTARFIHQNMTTGTPWSVLWYYNGELISREDLTWSEVDQQQGTNLATVRLATEGNVPLQPGQYRLELYIDGLLAARGDFVVAGADEGALPTVFSDLRFVNADTVDAAVNAASSNSFADRVASIYTLFDWRSLARGTLWRMRWSVDGVVFYDQISPWSLDFEGENFATRLQSTGAIPDGTYRLELSINNILLVAEEFQIGIGQLPIDPFASAEGVQLNGQIIDAETGEGIPGVTFMLLSADFSVEDFIWDADQIYATAVTDRNGRFQLDRLLQYEDPYSVIVAADGYIQISADGVVVNTETPNPQEIVIPLTRAQ